MYGGSGGVVLVVVIGKGKGKSKERKESSPHRVTDVDWFIAAACFRLVAFALLGQLAINSV